MHSRDVRAGILACMRVCVLVYEWACNYNLGFNYKELIYFVITAFLHPLRDYLSSFMFTKGKYMYVWVVGESFPPENYLLISKRWV